MIDKIRMLEHCIFDLKCQDGTAFVRKAGKEWYWLNTQGELIEN